MLASVSAVVLAAVLAAAPAPAKRVKLDPALGPALFDAIAADDAPRAKALLAKGADPDAVGADGNAAILHATFAGSAEIVD